MSDTDTKTSYSPDEVIEFLRKHETAHWAVKALLGKVDEYRAKYPDLLQQYASHIEEYIAGVPDRIWKGAEIRMPTAHYLLPVDLEELLREIRREASPVSSR